MKTKVVMLGNTLGTELPGFKNKIVNGGWIESLLLDSDFSGRFEIHYITCFNVSELREIEYLGVMYHIVPIQINKYRRVLYKLLGILENDDIYLKYYKQIIDKVNPDIIHVFGTEGNYGLISQYYPNKTVIHIQGILNVILQKWYSGFNIIAQLKATTFAELLHGETYLSRLRVLQKKADRELRIFKTCKWFIGRTDWDRRLTLLLSNNAKYFHCDEMLRDKFYESYKKNVQIDNLQIISVIRPETYKGIDTIINVYKILLEKNINFKWIVYGIAEDNKLFISAKKKIKLFNLNRLILKGIANYNLIITDLINSSIYFHPSYIENGCNSIQEAMLLGMPIVSVFTGGISTTINNYSTGILIQEGDYLSMAGAILEIIVNAELREKIASNARTISAKKYSKKQIIANIAEIYQEVLYHEDSSKKN